MRSLLVLLALAVPLVIASPAAATLPAGNIVQNGDAEGGPGATNQTDVHAPPGWQVLPNFTAVVYGTSGFPTTAISSSIGGGANFFAGGPDSGSDITAAAQDIDLSGGAPELDGDAVTATLSADVGGSGSQDDSVSIAVVFTEATGGSATGVLAVDSGAAADRDHVTGLVHRTSCTTLTPGTRRAYVQVAAQRIEPPYNDGYADNISVTLSTTPCPPAPDAPLEPPAPPQPAVSGNAEPTKGRIFVKRPGATKFQELRDAREIPVGSEIDATQGEVRLQMAASTTGATQFGKFRDGQFTMMQAPGRKLLTELVMAGGRFDKCPKSQQLGSAASKPSRRLWGNGKGRFRTRGRYASATVRGTQWMVQDSCSSTKVRVARGSVVVRDFAKRRNITLKAPKSYVARAPRR